MGVDDTGGVIRDPGGVGSFVGSGLPQNAPLWIDYAQVLQYGSQDRASSGREASSRLSLTTLAQFETQGGRPRDAIATHERALEMLDAAADPQSRLSLTTIEVRWGRNKSYAAGMLIYIVGSGERYQVDGVENLLTAYKKTQMTCRRIV